MPQKIQTHAESHYNPAALLDSIRTRLNLKNDLALSRALEVNPAVICKVRRGVRPIGAPLMIRVHELTGDTIGDIRRLLGDRRKHTRTSKQNRNYRANPGHTKRNDLPAANSTGLVPSPGVGGLEINDHDQFLLAL